MVLISLAYVSKLFIAPENLKLCSNDLLCETFWVRGVYWPFHESIYFLIVSMALILVFPFSFLKTWLKIMIPFSVLAFIAIIATPGLCGGMLCFDRTLVASGMSKIFLFLTILILLIKGIYLWIIARKSKKTKSLEYK